MAESLVRSNRALLFQDSCFSLIDSGDDELAAKARKELELYLRYQAHHDRAFQRYAAELRKLQSERKKAAIGFESQQRKQADESRKQERHECSVTLQKARLEQQLIKNRKLAAVVSVPEMNEKDLPMELAA
jgi:seryl-tRNA synthetase